MRPVRLLLRFSAVIIVAAGLLAAGLAALAPSLHSALWRGGSAQRAGLDQLDQSSERSYVYAGDGSLLTVLHAEENRSPVLLDQVPPIVVNAILDVEDERFWEHGALDLRSTLRAFATNAKAGSVLQGGSTITQQLVKNLLLSPERNVDRKVKEAVLAVQVENKLTKREILERYLNIVYFGNGAYGVQAAAETYFGKDVSQLDAGESAFLAGIIANPVGYDPVLNLPAAEIRRDEALDRMVANGHLTAAQAEQLKQRPVPTSVRDVGVPKESYFVEQVKQQLLDDPRLGDTPTERYNAVFRGGLRIYTTIDPKLQQDAEQSVRNGIPANKEGFTGALVAVDPKSGRVRALVGGPGFDTSKFDLATQGYRQPGSSFKLFTLLAMLEAGYGPDSTVNGTAPCKVDFPGFPNPTPINNSEGEGGGTMTVRKATALSINCAYVRIAATIGLDKVAAMARRLGLGLDPAHPIEEVPAMVIGSEEVTPLQMAAAYATLAADGVYHSPSFIDRVEDNRGKQLFKSDNSGHRVLSSGVSRVALDVLTEVVQKGTGTRARLPGRDVAGKTGTTDDYSNAWFVGMTPQLATAVWMGSPSGNIPMRNVGGVRVFGGTYPAHMWQQFMAAALAGQPRLAFATPSKSDIPKSTYLRGVPANGKDKHSKSDRPRRTTTTTAPAAPPAPAPASAP